MKPRIAALLPCISVLFPCISAEAQCYSRATYGCGHAVAAYVPAAANYSYPYTDNRLQVTYNVAFPPPALTGSTQYSYLPQNHFQFDPMEAYRLRLGFAQRSLDVAEAANASASLIVSASGATEDRAYRLAFADKLQQLLATNPSPGTTYEFRASRDASGKLQLGGGEVAPPLSAPEPGGPLGAANIFKAACVSCHNPTKHDGGLDLTDLSKLTAAAGEKILDRVTTNDTAKRMPKGGSLTSKQIFSLHQEYFQNAGAKQ